MSSSDKLQKITIGFHGGQALAARVKPAELTRLRAALGSEKWHDLDGEDGVLIVDLARIDYLLVEHEDHKVGF